MTQTKLDEEDKLEFSEETKRDLARARKDIKEGRVYTTKEITKLLKLNIR